MFLYYHEAFHHKTECFATRMEITHRTPFYKNGFEQFFQRTAGTDQCLEEGLANASALDLTWEGLRSKDIEQALVGYVKDSPPGYRKGVEIRGDMASVRCQFAEDNQRVCLPHIPRKNPAVWRTTPHMFNGISNVRSRVNYVISRNSPLIARMRVRPLLPPSKLVRKLKELVGLEFDRSGGNRDIYRMPNGKKIPISRHPRDLGTGVLRKILKEAGLNVSVKQFMQM
jgi:predicted RNA binding protein YcfA (HicA-like mRNA interferase family)